jgi:hypothetical protein
MSERHPYVLLRCDACGGLVDPALGRAADADADDAEFGPPASGLLLFARDGELRFEQPPLCSRCSVAIGVTALVRWAEEEEEG